MDHSATVLLVVLRGGGADEEGRGRDFQQSGDSSPVALCSLRVLLSLHNAFSHYYFKNINKTLTQNFVLRNYHVLCVWKPFLHEKLILSLVLTNNFLVTLVPPTTGARGRCLFTVMSGSLLKITEDYPHQSKEEILLEVKLLLLFWTWFYCFIIRYLWDTCLLTFIVGYCVKDLADLARVLDRHWHGMWGHERVQVKHIQQGSQSCRVQVVPVWEFLSHEKIKIIYL